MNQPYVSHASSPQLIALVDPYVYHAFQALNGKEVVVETIRGSIQGTVRDVKPDHIVISANQAVYYIRLAQVVSVLLSN